MTRTRARQRAHQTRQTRRHSRRTATRQLIRGRWDEMASGERMVRRTGRIDTGEDE